MNLSPRHLFIALVGTCLTAAGAACYFIFGDVAPPAPLAATTNPESAAAAESSPIAATTAAARIGKSFRGEHGSMEVAPCSQKIAGAIDALRFELDSRTARKKKLYTAASERRVALRILDSDPESADSDLTMLAEQADIPSLKKQALWQAEVLAEKTAEWQRIIETSPDEFARTAPKNPSLCGTGLEQHLLRGFLERREKFLAEGISANDPDVLALEQQVRSTQSVLVDSAVFKERGDLELTRRTIEELENPQKGLAAYSEVKTEYLAAKASLDETLRKYGTFYLAACPSKPTEDRRQQ